MKYKAIIFDMDGTIISTESVWSVVEKQLLKKYGNLSEQECLAILPLMKGASLYTSCKYIKDTFSPEESLEEILEMKQQLAFKAFENNISFIEGFDTFHKKLTDKNLVSAIATNSNQKSLDVISEQIALQKFFDQHIYSIDIVNKIPKPKPDIYLHAAQQLGVPPEQCIAIEDSATGIAAAKAAKMFCIGINTGNDRNTLSQADLIVDSYDEIDLESLLQ